MLGSNFDINSPQWTDVVFKNRNQAYGAYQLRKDNAYNTNRALLIATSIFLFAIAIPTLANKLMHGTVPSDSDLPPVLVVNIKQPVIIPDQKKLPDAPQKRVQTPQNMIADKPPVVTADGHETPLTVAQLAEATPGPQTIAGVEGAGPAIDEKVGPTNVQGSTEGTAPNDAPFVAVEIQPLFPGGEAAFAKFLQSHIRYPAVAKENGVQGRVFLQFVVERDGSLTDMKIVRDPGSGLGDEAARVLKMSPHWKPGIQNGKFVRVQYTVPVNFALEQ